MQEVIQNSDDHFYQSDLAYVHDVGHGEHAKYAASFLLDQLKKQKIAAGLIVDLGCGSGILASIMSQQGYDVMGVDYSKALIDIARKKAPQARFVISSLFDYEIPSCDAITSIGECLNYLFDGKSSLHTLETLFTKIYQSLKSPGIFVFDLVEPGLLGENPSQKRIVEHEEWTMFLDYTENREKQTLERNILLFRKINDLYRKSKEIHRLQLYERFEIKKLLEKAGFAVTLLDNYNGLPFREKHVGLLATKGSFIQ